MDRIELKALLEAIIYVSEEPATLDQLARVFTEVERSELREVLEELVTASQAADRGVEIRRIAGGYRMSTKPEHHERVRKFVRSQKPPLRFSLPALETLAVVAYKQPVSRGQVAEIRGVDSERALQTLQRRGLVQEIGHAPGPGQALLYGTTDLMLEKLGVNSIGELPPLADHVPPAEVVETLERPFRPEGSSNGSTS